MNKVRFSSSKYKLLVQAIAVIVSQLVVSAGPDKGAGHSNFPNITLPEPARGQKAVQALGAHLPNVAKAYGLGVAELQSLFASDDTLAVDRAGRLHFVEPTVEAAGLASEPAVEA